MLHMISEPEAAAIFALGGQDKLDLKTGDTYMLVDAGGGTVDLITYTVSAIEPKLELTEASPGTGALCGATFLNQRFEALLKKRLGNESNWDDEVLADAMQFFEAMIKKDFCGIFTEKYMVPVPGIGDNESVGVRRSRLALTGSDVRAVFEPVLHEVLSLVMAQIKASKNNIKGILLVGGFGENAYLRDVIRQEVQSLNIQVIQPQDGFVVGVSIIRVSDIYRWTAVVRGALMKGLASTCPSFTKVKVAGRSARKHYGINTSMQFDSEIHDIERRSVIFRRS